MRVLMDYRPALRERTGVGEYTHELAKALASTIGPPALELTIFSSSWRDRLRTNEPALQHLASIDRRIPVRLLNLLWHRLGGPPAETLTGRRFDVTHSPHPLLLPASDAAQVITIHDLSFLDSPDRARPDVRRHYPALVQAHAVRADRIIVSSRYAAGQIAARLGVPASKIALCPPGAPAWPPRRAVPASGYILFLGTIEPRKNVGVLLDAYERLLARPAEAGRHGAAGTGRSGTAEAARSGTAAVRNVPELVLAGKATAAAGDWLSRLQRPPLLGAVRHVGYVDPDRRQELYYGARMLVLPSLDEGFGLPVLEAMASGVPVIASNRGALPELVGDASPLVDPERVDDLAAAIATLLDDPGAADAAASKGLARAREFQWTTTARLVFDAYRDAIEHRRCASA